MRRFHLLSALFVCIFFFNEQTYAQEKILLKVKGGYRYVNENGEWTGPLIPTNLGIREQLKNGWLITYGDDYYYNCGIIDQKGRVILPSQYSYDMDFETGYLHGLNFIICSKAPGHYIMTGLVDTNGVQLLPFEYMSLEYYNGYWSYRKWDGESGIMDANFNVILKDFHLHFQLYDDLIVANNRDTSYIYNYAGQKIIPDRFQKLTPYFGGRCFVFKQNNRYGLFNCRGEILHQADLEMEPVFHPAGTALTREPGKGWNLIDTTGKLLIKPMENGYLTNPSGYINYSNSNLAFRSLNYWGIADRFGNNLVPYAYQEFALDSNAFQHDLYIFSTDTGWGVVNAQNKIILESSFDSVWVDKDGRVFVRENGKCGLFAETGKMLIPVENDEISPFEYGYAKFQKKGKWGLLNSSGQIFLAAEYDWISDYCKYAAVVKIRDQYALVDSTGKKLTPLYDEWISLNYYSCWNGSIIYEHESLNLEESYQGIPEVVDSNGVNISVKPYHFIMDIGDYFLVNKTGDYGDGYNPYYEGGLMNKQGKLILAPEKKTLIETVFSNRSFIVSTQSGHFYYSAEGIKTRLK